MNYLKALIEKDEQAKIDELKNIILVGQQLNKDVTPDKKKLEILEGRLITNPVTSKKRSTQSENSDLSSSNKDLFYSINSVYTSNNNIIVDFNVDINEKNIKFFKLNQNPIYKDVFDINGYFSKAGPTKLDIDGVDKITIGQFKPDVLRIVLVNKENLNTSYKINKKQLVISLTNSPIKNEVPKIEETKSIPNTNTAIYSNEKFIDKENSIRSIETQDDKIILKFNKSYYKRDVQFVRYKNASNYENVFNIKGKYKYTNPTKLDINGVDKIVISENDDEIKLRIINDYEQKVNYVLNDKELIITTFPKEQKVQQKAKKVPVTETKAPVVVTAAPVAPVERQQKKSINKTIVIDPGHGGEDAGAVGPSRRYEKVINFNVSKNLYSILKQRGYKVYLTRTNDTFIKVMNRTVLANEKNADLFISIHTNSVPKEKANEVTGIETFFLSPARNERAKRVAAIENKSDIREMSSSSQSVFLESLNRPRITASHKFAIDVQAGLLQATRSKYKDIKDSGVREGPFWVLVGAQMPSILVELGYVSHPIESKRLYDQDYQLLLANGIANGVDSYFSKNP
ncbi:MAG: N-acetylmuramoyl-L-alanine amidase [Aliarcobacter sp.]|jgi:N-acetylmuramoyl-L-alanine amidase|nr:N-acetylmuramoyl-L-alanine amidase [Aliarcobacter sp.]